MVVNCGAQYERRRLGLAVVRVIERGGDYMVHGQQKQYFSLLLTAAHSSIRRG